MTNAILMHGSCDKEEYFNDKYPSLSNSHWFPWLQKQLLINNIFAQTPEMLDAYKPDYSKWRQEFERLDVNENTILIGHSCGGGFLIRWLTENHVKVRKLILVAPWMDPSRRETTDFFDFEIDKSIQERLKAFHILVSDNERVEGVPETVRDLVGLFPKAELHEFHNMGHFTYEEMKSAKFPKLLELILE